MSTNEVPTTAQNITGNTAQSLNNLALLLYAQGDYDGARPFYERALAISEQVLGPHHPSTAQSLNNLALLLQAQGDYAGARPLYERALAIWEQVLGLFEIGENGFGTRHATQGGRREVTQIENSRLSG